MQELKANTQVKVVVGPFVDVGDGFTPETGVTLSGADEAELIKHDSGTVTSISGATFAAISSADGYYNLTLTTSHTDTEGMITVVVNDDDLCLPVIARFMVLSEAAYDSKYVAKDTGYMDVNLKAISEDTVAADNLESACDNYSATRGLAGTALPAAAADAAGGLPISDAGGLDLDTILDVAVSTRLAPTVASRTLDVAATGEAGVDLGNVTGTLTQANVGWVDANSRVDVGSWLGTAVTVSATTAKPEVDAHSISDNQAAADNVQANIGNLDAAVSGCSTHAAADVWTAGTRTLTAATNITSTGSTITIDGSGHVTLADGAHGGTSAVLTLERIVVASTTTNEPGVKITGDGTGEGVYVTSGAGDAVYLEAGTSGKAIHAVSTGTSAIVISSSSSNGTVWVVNSGSGATVNLDAGPGASIDAADGITGDLSGSVGSVLGGIDTTGGTITTLDGLNNLAATDLLSDGTALNTTAGVLDVVNLTNTTTTNTDMRGTDSAALASVCTEARLAELDAGNLPSDVAALQTDLDTITDTGVTCVALTTAAITDVWSTDTLTEAYAADGAAGTPAQILYMIQQAVTEASASGTTLTVKKLDGSTAAATFTLDDASNPTSRTRAT